MAELPEYDTPERDALVDAATEHWESMPKERQQLFRDAFELLRYHDDEPDIREIVAALIDGKLKMVSN